MAVATEVHVDRDTCGGYAYCVGSAPDVFDLDDDVKAFVQPDVSIDDYADEVRNAAWECPVRAITVMVDGVKVERE